MKIELVVNEPFTKNLPIDGGSGTERRSYVRGDVITDPAEIKAVRASHPSHVVARAPNPPEGDPDHTPKTAAPKPADAPKS